MGTSTPLEYSAKMRLAQKAATRSGKIGTEAGALLIKRLVLAKTPERLRNVGKNGRKLGVRYKVGDYGEVTKALVFVTGPFQLIERDTREHRIPRVRGARARKRLIRVPAAVSGSDSGVRAFANHPGTKGKHPFEKGVLEASRVIPQAYRATLVTELRAIF